MGLKCFSSFASLHFYAFSGTNLLTRCRSASSCFLLFLYFRKVVQEIFSELDETKAEVPSFTVTKLETRRESKKRREAATPGLGVGPGLAAPRGGEGPSGTHRARPSAHIFCNSGKP